MGTPLRSSAPTTDPAEVPTTTSADARSIPASARPATTPISHAMPVMPPPPRTSPRRSLLRFGTLMGPIVTTEARLDGVREGGGLRPRMLDVGEWPERGLSLTGFGPGRGPQEVDRMNNLGPLAFPM